MKNMSFGDVPSRDMNSIKDAQRCSVWAHSHHVQNDQHNTYTRSHMDHRAEGLFWGTPRHTKTVQPLPRLGSNLPPLEGSKEGLDSLTISSTSPGRMGMCSEYYRGCPLISLIIGVVALQSVQCTRDCDFDRSETWCTSPWVRKSDHVCIEAW
jgi:hypothetical protein